MEDFPENALRHIAEYIPAPSRILFAVALTAPSSSWSRCGADRTLSRAGKAVMPGCNIDLDTGALLPYYIPASWPEIDFERFNHENDWPANKCMNLTPRLDDGEVCGILVCCEARRDLRILRLGRCTGITGEGLAPLIGAKFLEYIDLSKTGICPCPMIYVLQSIIDQAGHNMVLNRLKLPDTWKEGQSKLVGPFLEKYNRDMNSRSIACSKCDAICVGTDQRPWAVQREDNCIDLRPKTCYSCGESYCSSCEGGNLQRCQGRCQKRYCSGCADFRTCEGKGCDVTKCAGCSFPDHCVMCATDTCDQCRAVECVSCLSDICRECSPANTVRCKGCGIEKEKTCLICLRLEDADLAKCVSCNDVYCKSCRTMEPCYKLSGTVCLQCHCSLHDNIECQWAPMPNGLRRGLDDLHVSEQYEELAVVTVWSTCIHYFHSVLSWSDKKIDLSTYRQLRSMQSSAYILAAHFVREGQDKKAVFMVAYSALVGEVSMRGANYVASMFEQDRQESMYTQMCAHFRIFRHTIRETSSRGDLVQFLQRREKATTHLLRGVVLRMDPIHSMKVGRIDPRSKAMAILVVSSHLYYQEQWESYYQDMPLLWLVKLFVFGRDTFRQSGNGSVKHLRVMHQGKTLFLSSAGKKSLWELGIRDGDKVMVRGSDTEEFMGDAEVVAQSQPRHTQMHKKAKKGRGKKQKKSKPAPIPLTDEQLEKKHRQDHSERMNAVFAELEPQLKQLRNELNNLVLKKSAPKQRGVGKAKGQPQPAEASTALPADDSLGGKSGKVVHPILVGEPSNLYKTRKTLGKVPIVLDLHGLTRDEALIRLNESLPVWMDTAMRGEDPWVIPVDMVCGGGSQILSETVQYWILTNRQVANRPKSR